MTSTNALPLGCLGSICARAIITSFLNQKEKYVLTVEDLCCLHELKFFEKLSFLEKVESMEKMRAINFLNARTMLIKTFNFRFSLEEK